MRKLASIRKVSAIEPIEGADRIEIAVVDGWKCVIKKGEFQPGDTVVYVEIDAFLPVKDEFEFLRKSSFRKMGDEEGFRLRTVKLRGQISQGLVLPVSVVGTEVEIGQDVTELLGIKKFEPPVPASLAGEVRGAFPAVIRKTDEERVQNMAADYPSFAEKDFYVSEKLDGTSMTVFFDGERFGVCGRNWELEEAKGNTYWDVARGLNLETKIRESGRALAFQGELIGPKIQKNRYKLNAPEFHVFNVFDIATGGYVAKEEMGAFCESFGVTTVPFIAVREVPESIDEILKSAEGPSVLNADTEREGLVWVHGDGPSRISFKTISNKFLAKGD